MHIKQLVAVFFILFLAVLVTLRVQKENTEKERQSVIFKDTLSISASIYPLSYLASEIAGPKIPVRLVTPPGVEPHDFELSPQDMAAISTSEIIFLIGDFEPWANKIPVANGKPVVIQFIHAFENSDLVTDKLGKTNPHIWISPKRAIVLVQAMRDAFIQADPLKETEYAERAKNLLKKLIDLDRAYTASLASCRIKSFVTSHDAFSYLSRDYGITTVPISGLSPDEEPTAKTLTDLKVYIQKNGIRTIFTEELGNNKFAQTLASEVGVTIRTLSPIEGLTKAQSDQNSTYISLLKSNLDTLKEELLCD